MTALTRLKSILAAPDWRPAREIDAEIREEFEFHREMLARDLAREGYSADAARREAARRFGDEQRLTRECRTIIKGSRTMINLALVLIGVGFIGSVTFGMQEGRRNWTRLAPFSDVRWVQDAPEILHEGRWFALTGINGLSVEAILAHCATAYPGIEKKRFSEDLVDVLADMGHKPGAAVSLEVRSLDDGAALALANVALTSENRRAVWTSNLEREGAGFSRRLGGPSAPGGDRWMRQTPFTGLRWNGTTPEVEVDGAWYELRSANGVKTTEMLGYCADEFPGKERERFSEDFADVLKGLGALEGTLVDLELRDAETGAVVTRAAVPLSAENRRRVREFNRAQGAAEEFSAEESAAVRTAAVAPTRAPGQPDEAPETPWRAYTRAFIERFSLDEGQSAVAWRLCDRCEAEKKRYLAANEDEIREVRERLATAAEEGAKGAAAAQHLKRRIAEFDESVERIFEKRLKPGLEKLPTRAQRAAAGDDASKK